MSGYKPSIIQHAFARGRALEHVLTSVNSPGKFSSPEKTIPGSPVTLCICGRQKQKILCRSCGHVFDGRIRKKCVLHPNEIHLMDQLCCPLCKTTYLQEIGSVSGNVDTDTELGLRDMKTDMHSPDKVPLPSLNRTDSDRILLHQLGKKIQATSSENWEDDLAKTSLENLRY